MSKKTKNRIFLVAPKDLSSTTCVGKMTQGDRIFLITDEEPQLKDNIIRFLNGRDRILNTDEQDIYQHMVDECEGDENIYFVGSEMSPYYDSLCERLLDVCSGIGFNKTFGVNNVKLKRKQAGLPESYMDTFLSGIEEETLVPEGEVGKQPIGTPEKEQSLIPTDIDLRWEPEGPPRDVQKQKKTKEARRKNKADKNQEKAEMPDMDIQLPEKKYTDDLSGKRALFMCALRERINRHICESVGQELSVEQCFQFTVLLLKCDHAEQLLESWACTEPRKRIKLQEGQYKKLKEETVYYSKVCDLLYGGDLWEY